MDTPASNTPIAASLRQDQNIAHGMSNGDLYVNSLIRHTEASVNRAMANLAECQDELAKLRAAIAAGITWQ